MRGLHHAAAPHPPNPNQGKAAPAHLEPRSALVSNKGVGGKADVSCTPWEEEAEHPRARALSTGHRCCTASTCPAASHLSSQGPGKEGGYGHGS